jgi:SNF2 family DNA or RNA helicase
MMGEGPIGKHQVQGWINQDEFNHLLNLLMFRVDSEVLDLPPAVDMRRYCALEKEALRVYSNLEAEFISDVGTGVVTAGNALTRLLRLQQVTSGFVTDEEGRERDLGSEKATLLATLLEDIPAHEKIVVFCRFRHDLRVVRECAEAAGRAYGELSGTDNDLEGGQIPSHVNVLGTQIQAGGLGVNLIAARHCVFYSLGFSLGDYLQARKRVHRGGQEKNVVYTHLIAQGTVDEKVYEALEKKEKVVEAIMDYVKKGDA